MSQLWWSIEVLHGPFSADRWRDAHGDALMEAAVSCGSPQMAWVIRPWGIVFEVAFIDIDAWAAFRAVPRVQAALDQVPDKVSGLFVHRGQGGTEGARDRLRPRPVLGAGGAPLPVREPMSHLRAIATELDARETPPPVYQLSPVA